MRTKYYIVYSNLYYYTNRYWQRYSHNKEDCYLYDSYETALHAINRLIVFKPDLLQIYKCVVK